MSGTEVVELWERSVVKDLSGSHPHHGSPGCWVYLQQADLLGRHALSPLGADAVGKR